MMAFSAPCVQGPDVGKPEKEVVLRAGLMAMASVKHFLAASRLVLVRSVKPFQV